MSWDKDFEDFMGYMATHPEEFPEEHQAMDNLFRRGTRKKKRSFLERMIDQDPIDGSRDVVGDQRCYFASFHYFKEDRSEVTHWIRTVLWFIIGVMLLPIAFGNKSDTRAEIASWEDSTRYILLGIIIFCLVLLFVLCFKKFRIRRDCRWKYGWEEPPESMQLKIMRYHNDENMAEDEKKEIKRLLYVYPAIWRPDLKTGKFYKH